MKQAPQRAVLIGLLYCAVGAVLILSAGKVMASVVFVFGVGAQSCGAFVQAAKAEQRQRLPGTPADAFVDPQYSAFVDFADGMLTGLNVLNSAHGIAGQHSDYGGRMAWLDTYCRAHLLERYAFAVEALRQSLIEHGQ